MLTSPPWRTSNKSRLYGRVTSGNYFVCKVEIDVDEAPGEKTVGVDLGINNFAALAYEDGHSELYPLNCLKQDDYYFSKLIARCDNSDSEQATRLNQKKSARRTPLLPHPLQAYRPAVC